jgi:hypothetical protein
MGKELPTTRTARALASIVLLACGASAFRLPAPAIRMVGHAARTRRPELARAHVASGDVSAIAQLVQANAEHGRSALEATAYGAYQTYASALGTHPTRTKVLTAVTLTLLGDAISQTLGARRAGAPLAYDTRRAAAFATHALLFTGLFQAWWFGQLNSHFVSAPDAETSARVAAAATKTLLCQLGSVPLLYYPSFFALTGVARGLTAEQSVARARAEFVLLLTRNWLFWIPVQFGQFALVPSEWQVVYVCCAALCWSIILSTLTAPPAASAPSAPGK